MPASTALLSEHRKHISSFIYWQSTQMTTLLHLLDKKSNTFGLCKWKYYACLFAHIPGKWDTIICSHSGQTWRCIIKPGVCTQSCPLVIKSARTHGVTQAEQRCWRPRLTPEFPQNKIKIVSCLDPSVSSVVILKRFKLATFQETRL